MRASTLRKSSIPYPAYLGAEQKFVTDDNYSPDWQSLTLLSAGQFQSSSKASL